MTHTPQQDPVDEWMTSKGFIWHDRQHMYVDNTDAGWRGSVSHETATWFYQQILEAQLTILRGFRRKDFVSADFYEVAVIKRLDVVQSQQQQTTSDGGEG